MTLLYIKLVTVVRGAQSLAIFVNQFVTTSPVSEIASRKFLLTRTGRRIRRRSVGDRRLRPFGHSRICSAELNQAIAELVADLNTGPMRRLGVSRRDLFLELDRPALKPLPDGPSSTASSTMHTAFSSVATVCASTTRQNSHRLTGNNELWNTNAELDTWFISGGRLRHRPPLTCRRASLPDFGPAAQPTLKSVSYREPYPHDPSIVPG
jgi:hypothetical protein